MHEHTASEDLPDAATYWESRYADQERMWSGRANAVLSEVARTLPSSTALDLGCGEGGDVIWLAAQGWHATGVDLSPTATERGTAAATAAGLGDQVHLVAADLASWDTDERFALVTASFLQSWPVEIPRAAILRRATRFVAPDGHLLVTAHATPPGGMPEGLETYRFPTPEEDLVALGVADDADWQVVVAEVRPRTVTRDDGSVHDVRDSVVLVRRR
ncbi:class I SAM-dependent methyltransferase [Curtobacterium sp. MCBA15_001]|uniref:class I SAM-dependent methyltransferase n=1 Tax=Curtobacterium sp. MCBA15_001 TaxID=1898731 RepID=UPI0008DE7278|nr:class I SAM-dependent methyltransferase [Curtobacterium sp. MCBA15_001]OIH98326.1 hypothetical protein BIU90_00055 [Curtobacterium sp. MCBA15_001]